MVRRPGILARVLARSSDGTGLRSGRERPTMSVLLMRIANAVLTDQQLEASLLFSLGGLCLAVSLAVRSF